MHNLTKQRGTALIVALFVVALVAAAAIAMIDRLRIDTRRTELLLNDMQANLYAQGSIAWAMNALIDDQKLKQAGKVVDHTPIESPVNEMNGAKIYSVIYDAQANFNLNNLTDQKAQDQFSRLVHILAPNMGTGTTNEILVGIADWIKPDNSHLFEDYYAKLKPPYTVPHRSMISVSELSAVKGVTPQLFSLLAPVITALPSATKININNAPIPVLLSLSQTMTLEAASAVDQRRKQTPFVDTSDFLNLDIVKNMSIAENTITTLSDYFLVETHVLIGDQHITINTLLQRSTKNSQPIVAIIWQSKGTL